MGSAKPLIFFCILLLHNSLFLSTSAQLFAIRELNRFGAASICCCELSNRTSIYNTVRNPILAILSTFLRVLAPIIIIDIGAQTSLTIHNSCWTIDPRNLFNPLFTPLSSPPPLPAFLSSISILFPSRHPSHSPLYPISTSTNFYPPSLPVEPPQIRAVSTFRTLSSNSDWQESRQNEEAAALTPEQLPKEVNPPLKKSEHSYFRNWRGSLVIVEKSLVVIRIVGVSHFERYLDGQRSERARESERVRQHIPSHRSLIHANDANYRLSARAVSICIVCRRFLLDWSKSGDLIL